MTATESFHAWLIKHRVYCEYSLGHHLCYEHANHVRNVNGHDKILCSEHASRIDAVRKSERKQIPQ